MNQKFKKHMMMKKVLTAFVMLLAVTPVFAQGGASAITNAANDINIKGSTVVSDGTVQLTAENNINIFWKSVS